jgi:hypothetical protein
VIEILFYFLIVGGLVSIAYVNNHGLRKIILTMIGLGVLFYGYFEYNMGIEKGISKIQKNLTWDVNSKKVSKDGFSTFISKIEIVYMDGKIYQVNLVPGSTKQIE